MRYVLVGGNVVSRTDGQMHYVSPYALSTLYGLTYRVPSRNITFLHDVGWAHGWLRGRDLNGLYVLHPRDDGEYEKVAQWLREREGCDAENDLS
jgi:hypothetical protein